MTQVYDALAIARRVLADPRRARVSHDELEAICSWIELTCAEGAMPASLAAAVAAVIERMDAIGPLQRVRYSIDRRHLDALEAALNTLKTRFEQEFPR